MSGAGTARLVVSVAALGAASCQLATDFSLVAISETTEELCSDGKDTDFDGLADCQDWNCLDKLVCCDIPEVVLADDFESGPEECSVAECAVAETCSPDPLCGPEPTLWHIWPCPYPRVCGGAFHLDKETCFAAGALSKTSVSLEPGLVVQAGIVGRPERRGYVEIALSLQDEAALAGSLDPCGRDQRVLGFAALRQVWSEGGYRVSAQLQQNEIGLSAEVTDPDSIHSISLGIDRERRLAYSLDGVVFAEAAEPVPTTDEEARVVMSGLTMQVAITEIRVQAGLRCHDPRAWTTAGADIESSLVLARETEQLLGFDRDEVFAPSAELVDGGVELYYTGCQWLPNSSLCEPYEPLGIGVARSIPVGPYQRDGDNPLLVPADLANVGLTGIFRALSLDVLPGAGLHGYVAPGWDAGVILLDDTLDLELEVLGLGAAGTWDEGEICCVAALESPDGTRYLWYAGRTNPADPTWRIGVAVASDGVTFERYPDNPVVDLGLPGGGDSEAVTSPVVVYDAKRLLFRMWYEGLDFFGKTSIGYAVSTDGLRWHKWPGNPVMVPEPLGLASIGGPDVHLATDGRLRAWVHGTTDDGVHRRIFELRNQGALVDP